MAGINTNRSFTTEQLFDAICNYLGVEIYDNEHWLSSFGGDNPIKVAKPNMPIFQVKEQEDV